MTLPPRIPIHVTRRDGGKVTINGVPGKPLLHSLLKAKVLREKTCEGAINCSLCHVFVDRTEGLLPDEHLKLANLTSYQYPSRLACRVPVTDYDGGMKVRIAPEEEE